MIRVQWDQEEMVALVDLFFRTQHCKPSKRSSLIDELSIRLNRRADLLNIPHDKFFRNHNGITMMLMNLKSIASSGKEGLNSTSKLMKETWELYHEKHEEFLEILVSFNQKYAKRIQNKQINNQLSARGSHPSNTQHPSAEKNNKTENREIVPVNAKSVAIPEYVGKVTDLIGPGLRKYIEEKEIPLDKKLYEFLNCDPEDWKSVPLSDLRLSVRAENRLTLQVNTIEELLHLTFLDVAAIRGMGIKSFDEIFDVLNVQIRQTEKTGEKNEAVSASAYILNQELLEHLSSIIAGRWEDIAEEKLSSESRAQLLQLKDALDLLGIEMIQHFISNPTAVLSLLENVSNEMSKLSQEKDQLHALLAKLPPERLHKNALGFIVAKYPSDADAQNQLLACFGDEESTIKDVLTNLYTVQDRPLHLLFPFLQWCSFRIEDEVNAIASLNRDERNLRILKMRSQGYTLNDIGNTLGLTRERVRQLENKLRIRFGKFQKSQHLLLKISAFRNGDSILTSEEIKPFLGDQADCLLYLFKTTPSTDYTYSKKYDAFTIGLAGVEKQVEEYVDRLPDRFSRTDYEKYLTQAEEELALPRELVTLQIDNIFNQSDVLFYRGRISTTEMCARILEKYYPDGIHVHSDDRISEFRKRVLEDFGDDARIAENTRAIAARIMSVGILCGRGMYKPKENVHIADSLLTEIKQFILSYEYPIVLMNTLFAQFENPLRANGVNNKYYLQGILRDRFGDEFHFRRDYVSRDAEVTSLYTSIVDYIREFDYPITKAQIFSAFPGISDIIINLAVIDESILNYFGEYIHIDHLKVQQNERAQLKRHIDSFLADGATHNSRALYMHIAPHMPYELKRWYIRYHFQLFSLCENLFKDEYQFSRPYLAPLGIEIMHENQQVLEYLSKTKENSVSDLFDFLQSRQIRIMDSLKYINSLNEEYLLVNQQTIMNIDDIGVTEMHCQMIEELILGEITECVPIKDLVCIFRFPKLSVRWTDWLVYSILNKWATKVEVYTSYNQFRYAIPLVAPKGVAPTDDMLGKAESDISSTYVFDDFDEDIEDIITEYLEEDLDESI